MDIAASGISITPERQNKALFSLAYLRDGKTPIARCEHLARFQTLAQINQPDVRLIVNPGGTNERFARANAPLAQLTVYPDNVTIFDQIVSGAADLMMTDALEARLQQRIHPALCAVHPEAPFDHAEKGHSAAARSAVEGLRRSMAGAAHCQRRAAKGHGEVAGLPLGAGAFA